MVILPCRSTFAVAVWDEVIAFFNHLSVNESVAVDDTHNEEWIILCDGVGASTSIFHTL